jgi:hypothetical protein
LFEYQALSLSGSAAGTPLVLDLSPPGGSVPLGTAFPANAVVEGQATDFNTAQPVEAAVTLTATKIEGASTQASFVKTVQTDDKGVFRVEIPPGEYQVRATPLPSLGLSTAETTWRIRATTELQAGKLIELPSAPVLSGEAVLSGNGGFAFGATASAVVSPKSVISDVFELAGLQDAPDLRRTSADLISANGRFEISVDSDPVPSGVDAEKAPLPSTYDFFVKPETRSNYPWLVRPWILVPFDGLELTGVKVPLPFVYRGDLVVDGTTNRVPGALVRAYAYLTEKAELTSDVSQAATVIPVAEARADENGAFELLIPASLDVR